MLESVRIVLVETSHAGNIGATARAMKNMGLRKLYLVKPKIFPHVDATARAAGADNLLAEAKVVDSLDEALADCKFIIGTSARLRSLPLPAMTPRECAEKIKEEVQADQVAIVFGRESSGLNNDELQKCHYQLHIPTAPDFSSLNLAAAVQVVTYELWQTMGNFSCLRNHPPGELATAQEMSLFYDHLHQVLSEIKFLNSKHSKKLMRRLHRLFNRARLDKTELNILRGILTSVQQATRKS